MAKERVFLEFTSEAHDTMRELVDGQHGEVSMASFINSAIDEKRWAGTDETRPVFEYVVEGSNYENKRYRGVAMQTEMSQTVVGLEPDTAEFVKNLSNRRAWVETAIREKLEDYGPQWKLREPENGSRSRQEFIKKLREPIVEDITKMYMEGKTLEEISKKHSVSSSSITGYFLPDHVERRRPRAKAGTETEKEG